MMKRIATIPKVSPGLQRSPSAGSSVECGPDRGDTCKSPQRETFGHDLRININLRSIII